MPEPREAAELAHELAILIGRVNRRMRTPGGRSLGHGHLSAIATLSQFGPLRLGDLAVREVVSAPSMTRTVTDLERRGLVTRSPDPLDGRSVLVAVTDEGVEVVRQGRSERAALLAELIAGLEPEQVAALERVVPVLRELSTSQR